MFRYMPRLSWFERLGLAGVIAMVVCMFLAAFGWGLNIYKLIMLLSTDGPVQLTGILILRIIGLYPVFGAIIGWF